MSNKMEKAKPEAVGRIVEVPDYLQPVGGIPRGGEHVDSTDIKVPRLALAQQMSEELIEDNPKHIEGLKQGHFFNTVTKEVFGNRLQVLPVFKFTTRIRFAPRDQGKGLLCQAPDGKTGIGDPGGDCLVCPLSQFKNGTPPECTEFKNMALLTIPAQGLPTPTDASVISFKRASLDSGKEWITLLRQTRRDYFTWIFDIFSVLTKMAKGSCYVPRAQFSTRRSDSSIQDEKYPPSWASRELVRIGEQAYAGVRELQEQGRLKVDIAEEEENETFDPEKL